MIGNTEKLAFCGVGTLHVIILFMWLISNEAVIFGIRSFNEKVSLYTGVEIILFIVSFVLIYKNSRIAYVFLVIALVSSYIIFMGHWLGIYQCPYCEL